MAMSGKTAAEKRFDAILRRMLLSKPLSRAEISAKIQARRKAAARGEVILAILTVELERNQRLVR